MRIRYGVKAYDGNVMAESTNPPHLIAVDVSWVLIGDQVIDQVVSVKQKAEAGPHTTIIEVLGIGEPVYMLANGEIASDAPMSETERQLIYDKFGEPTPLDEWREEQREIRRRIDESLEERKERGEYPYATRIGGDTT